VRRLLVCAALFACGCQARTEIVLGVITDLLAPDVLDTVKLMVTNSDTGQTLIERDWSIPGTPNTEFILPGSFGLYSDDGSEPRVQIDVTGHKGTSDSPAIVTHRSVINLIHEQTLFLRESLVAGCQNDTDCKLEANQTCVEGRCVDNRIDARMLPKYREELITTVECDSGTRFVNTATKEELVPAGDCDANQLCQEGTCYTPPAPPSAPTWHAVASNTTANLTAIIGVGSPPTLFAVGAKGTILRLGPASPTAAEDWVAENSTVTSDLFAAASNPGGVVLAVGAGGVILRRDQAGTWTERPSATTADLQGVYFFDGQAWAVGGAQGHAVVVFSTDGGLSWTVDGAVPAGAGALRGISGTGPFNIFMAGRGGTTLHLGSEGYVSGPTSTENFTSVFAPASGGAYFAATSGALYSTTDGAELTAVDLGGNSNALTDVFGFANEILAVGNGGAIFHGGPGRAFGAEYADLPAHLAGVWADSLEDAWAVGVEGEILHATPPSGADLALPLDGGTVDLTPPGDLLACGPVSVQTVGKASVDGGAGFSKPVTVTYDGAQFLYVLNQGGQLVMFDAINGTLSFQATFGLTLGNVVDLAADTMGNLYGVDPTANQVIRLTPNATSGGFDASPVAGNGQPGFADGNSDVATFNQPNGVAVDAAGTAYVIDSANFAVRTVTAAGDVVTLAGTGTQGNRDGTGGQAGTTQLGQLVGITVEPKSGDTFVVDSSANTLRRIAPDGTTTTFLPLAATGLAADGQGHLYTYSNGLVQIAIAGGTSAPLVIGGSGFVNGAGCAAEVGPFNHLAVTPAGQQAWMLDTPDDLIRTALFP
jgi:sugar lactone lactonase YvrE